MDSCLEQFETFNERPIMGKFVDPDFGMWYGFSIKRRQGREISGIDDEEKTLYFKIGYDRDIKQLIDKSLIYKRSGRRLYQAPNTQPNRIHMCLLGLIENVSRITMPFFVYNVVFVDEVVDEATEEFLNGIANLFADD